MRRHTTIAAVTVAVQPSARGLQLRRRDQVPPRAGPTRIPPPPPRPRQRRSRSPSWSPTTTASELRGSTSSSMPSTDWRPSRPRWWRQPRTRADPSDRTTQGGAAYAEGQTASGVAGTAVDGFPADTIDVALDELGLEPDLVVSGVNEGQNTGPLAYISGTVGAARAAVRRGIPAVAGSAGLGEDADYAGAAVLIVEWIDEHRGDLAGCDRWAGGQLQRARLHGGHAPRTSSRCRWPRWSPEGVNPFESDCSLEPAEEPTDDVTALAAGHAALTLVPPEPLAA